MTDDKAMRLWHYRARVERVIDGDTIQVTLDLGLHCYRVERLRLLGINAPEPDVLSRAAADAATMFVREWLYVGALEEWSLVCQTQKADSFGRYLATVWRASDWACLNEDIVAAGHAVTR